MFIIFYLDHSALLFPESLALKRKTPVLTFPLIFLFIFFRWQAQDFSDVHPSSPHHHRGHAGQQRHRPPPEHVAGALPVPVAGELPGWRIGSAFGARRGCFHLQHPAGSGRGARRHLERQLLGRTARRTVFPLGGPGRAAVPEQAEADVADPDGGQCTFTSTA